MLFDQELDDALILKFPSTEIETSAESVYPEPYVNSGFTLIYPGLEPSVICKERYVS